MIHALPTTMLRLTFLKGALNTSRSARISYSITQTTTVTPVKIFVRLESSQASDLLKKARKIQDDLQRDWKTPVVTYEQVKPRSESPSPDAYLIDVREPDEVLQGSIPSSVNIPLSSLATDLHLSSESFKEKFGFAKPKKNQEIVFYCRSGKRASTAGDIAKRNGYSKIYNYEGSWLEWVEKESKKP